MTDFQYYDFFSVFATVYRSLALSAKSGAKVLLFDELTKYSVKILTSIDNLTYQHSKTGSIGINIGNTGLHERMRISKERARARLHVEARKIMIHLVK